MIKSELAAAFCVVLTGWFPMAEAGGGFADPFYAFSGAGRTDFERALDFDGRGGLVRVSEKSREIARRLDGSGYYSRLSRAYKGYPHLRSKAAAPPRVGTGSAGVNLENQRLFRSRLRQIARAHRLAPELLDAVILVESAYDPGAVSPKGAMGLMQLMPDTAERFEVSDAFDPTDNMRGGARYLRWLMDRFDGELELVLAAYNAGEGAVERHGNRIPPYQETQDYVARVLGLYKRAQP
ncbi:MAG: lytic transglycosylase domain-containing protein [Thiohalocapsa sp.]